MQRRRSGEGLGLDTRESDAACEEGVRVGSVRHEFTL